MLRLRLNASRKDDDDDDGSKKPGAADVENLRRSNETFSGGCLVNTRIGLLPPRRDYAGIDKTFAHIVLYQIKILFSIRLLHAV